MTGKLDNTVVKEIFIECRPETLFPFLTDPDKMVQWIGRHVLLEPKIGGSLRIDFNGKDSVIGKYVEVVPYEKVIMTWGWIDSDTFPPGSSTVEFHLREQGDGTLLVLTHSGVPTVKRTSHLQGWIYYTARLKAVMLGHDPGPDTFAVTSN